MRVFAFACTVTALAQGAQARDVALALDWPEGMARAAEIVAVTRDASGVVLGTQRTTLPEGTQEAVLSLPSLSRQATTVQVGALLEGAFALQSLRAPVEGGQPPDQIRLSAALTASFSAEYFCDTGRVISLRPKETGFTLDGQAFEPTPLANSFTAPDGTTVNRAPGLLQLERADGALLETCQPIPARSILPLTALEQDAAWRLETGLDGSDLTLAGARQAVVDTPVERLATTIAPAAENRLRLSFGAYELTLDDTPCRLVRSTMPFPLQATLIGPDMTTSTGCAGDPLRALEGPPWQVTHMSGHALLRAAEGNSSFTLQFDTGRLTGRTTCNRYLGRATVDGTRLVLSDLGSTRLPCPANLRNLETRFLDAMEAATSFLRLPDGRLALYAGATAVLIAER